MDLHALTQSAAPWLHLLPADAAKARDHLLALEHPHPRFTVRVVRGKKAGTPQQLFDEIAGALQFPLYFGENWDALNDCLHDLRWLKTVGLTLLIVDSGRLLEHATPEHQHKFATILQESARHWNLPKKGAAQPFHVVFQTTPAEESLVAGRWKLNAVIKA